MKTKPEVLNITFTGGKTIKLLDSELGTALVIGNRIKLNTFPGGNAVECSFPWNTTIGKVLVDFLEMTFVYANLTIDASGFIKFEAKDESGNQVSGIVNANNMKLSQMCREIADGTPSTEYLANARIVNVTTFENAAYNLAELLEKYNK